jgi:lysophospholipase L1-like esterase
MGPVGSPSPHALGLCCGLVAVTFVALRPRLNARQRLSLLGLDLAVLGGAFLADPAVGLVLPAGWGLVALHVILALPTSRRILERPGVARALRVPVAIAAVVVPLAALELVSAILIGLGWGYKPIVTMMQSPDKRGFHMTADPWRVPDPVLLWRQAPIPPFNREGFRGPEVVTPRPRGVFRIFAYGDSNTERMNWEIVAATLRDRFPSRSFEVENAGVGGYSSLQGVRWLEATLRLEPDLVLASFGWNDATSTTGLRDGEMQIRSMALVSLERRLLGYRSYLLLKGLVQPKEGEGPEQRRVTPEEYRENLRRFVALARSRGARVALETRPYRESDRALSASTDWRRFVPEYNPVVYEVARELSVPLIDLRAAMEPADFEDECHVTAPGSLKLLRYVARRLEEEHLLE